MYKYFIYRRKRVASIIFSILLAAPTITTIDNNKTNHKYFKNLNDIKKNELFFKTQRTTIYQKTPTKMLKIDKKSN